MSGIKSNMRYWLECAGFRTNRYKKRYCYTAQRDTDHRCIRVLYHLNLIQICDGEMDRWANSVGAESSIPKTHKEFNSTITKLLLREYRRNT